ncbi:MAG: segregation/condensation protein A [Anaerolineales bacterium]|nr:segregation/condensation protein A [Anaerolineales bacterium]
MTASAYQIEVPAFAGPLDLLLHLIDRQELDITSISLMQITGQYLQQVEQMKGNRVEQLIDFIVIGARLAQIKSRALLPQIPMEREDEEEEDPAEALIRQLKQYRRFKQAAEWFQGRQEAGLRTYLRVAPPPKLESRLDLSGVSVGTLLTAVRDILARAENMEESVAIVQPRRITIEDQLKRIRHQLTRQTSFFFQDILSHHPDRVEVSVTLLAMLELIKRRELIATQTEMFGPIELRKAPTRAVATTTAAAALVGTPDTE